MLARIALFALMAVGLAGFGAVTWVSLHPPNAAPQVTDTSVPAKDTVPVLVAARALRAGTLLKP